MATEEKINWYRTPIEKKKLRQLTEKNDLSGLFHIVAQLALYAVTAAFAWLSYIYLHWAVFILALFVHCSFVGHLYSPLHEMIHQTPFKSRKLNEFFYKLISFMIWVNPVTMRIGHMNHHHVTMYNGLDYENPMPRVYKRWYWLLFWTFVPFDICLVPGLFSSVGRTVRLALGNIEGYSKTCFKEQDIKKQQEAVNFARFLLVGHGLLISIFLYIGFWPLILIINFPVFFAVAFGQLTGMTQHIGMIHGVPDFRLCSRTILLNPFLRFLYWNMNYHIEHHMYAAVPYCKLGALRKEIEHDLPEAQRGLWVVWKEISAVVKRQRTDPGYCIVPKVPNPKIE